MTGARSLLREQNPAYRSCTYEGRCRKVPPLRFLRPPGDEDRPAHPKFPPPGDGTGELPPGGPAVSASAHPKFPSSRSRGSSTRKSRRPGHGFRPPPLRRFRPPHTRNSPPPETGEPPPESPAVRATASTRRHSGGFGPARTKVSLLPEPVNLHLKFPPRPEATEVPCAGGHRG